MQIIQAGSSSRLRGSFSPLKLLKKWPFLTRELRMRNTSYRELLENFSLARWAVNIMQMRCARGLLLNCCSSSIEISCFKGQN